MRSKVRMLAVILAKGGMVRSPLPSQRNREYVTKINLFIDIVNHL